MAQEAAEALSTKPAGRKRRILRNALRLALALLVLALGYAWFDREQIADSFLSDYLAEQGVQASYQIDRIGTGQQVISNLVIGDPARPDLTVERVEVSIAPRWGIPAVTSVRLVNPRLYGSYRDGQLSFGALDPLVFTGSEEPFEFPDMTLAIEDGRALIETDYGRVGARLAGSGHLRGGFSGELAAVMPELALAGCQGQEATLYGTVSIDAERPRFQGPLRLADLACDNGLAVQQAGVALDLRIERSFEEFDGTANLSLASLAMADAQAAVHGTSRFSWDKGDLTAEYDLAADHVASAQAQLGELALEGRLRALDSFARVEMDGDLTGEDLRLGPELDQALAAAAESGEGTLAQPLLARLRGGLARELPGSRLAAGYTLRHEDGRTSLVVPDAFLRGRSGASLLALSRAQFAMGDGLPRFSGNFATGGTDLPQVSGRVERLGNGGLQMQLAMREYAAGTARLALPRLTVRQASDGALALDGNATASGPLPGGMVSNLQLPIDAQVASNGDLALWQGCRQLRFDRLAMASLTLGRQSLTLCPQRGQPILRYGAGGLRLAVGANALQLAGELADTPIRIASGPIGVAYPGVMAARDLAITLGPADSAQRFTVTDLRADLSADSIGGEFTGADVFLASVPLDVLDASGRWAYADSRFTVTDASLRLEDREATDRFQPVGAHEASLSLADNLITADAVLRHPSSDTPLSRVHIVHNLSSSTGHADLIVDGVTFGPHLQIAPPAADCLPGGGSARVEHNGLTCLALGVVSDVSGTVTGTGRIDWNAEAVTSSGSFTSQGLDLAAAFGPVHGAAGTIEFTDLLGMTTAPSQRITVEAINPGIEVYDGEMFFQLEGGELLRFQGAHWPFMGGTLTMLPVDLRFGAPEVRRYVMVIDGLEANQFVERMEMSNLAANGTFDGIIPIVFDEDGNGQLEGGALTSRPPGGNVAYVGELSYEDMGFFANYAFRTLRDLQFNRMEIQLNGPLTGELVTQVRFEGIRQGASAERNLISRAIGSIPIELRVNIRAPFYKLMTSIRALYDPASIRDPRDLGLLRDDGVRL
ncbi:MAG: YdbH domain-containing protein, partial [Erythrobacter sp.]|nr:YdbH domain-containing protein [Erythrobacter sp.]